MSSTPPAALVPPSAPPTLPPSAAIAPREDARRAIGEVAGVEKIGNRYYLIQHYAEHMLGNRQVRQHLGREEGTYLFVADRSEGPFRPDVGGYRWPPTYNVFTRFHAAPGETLVNLKSVAICGNGRALWLSPLKKAVVDADGHLRLGY